MALDLLTTQKAKITVSHDDGAGNVTDLGAQFHFAFEPTGVATLQGFPDGLYVVALAEGATSLNLTAMDGSLPTAVLVTVSLDNDVPVPSLVVTFGAPVAK